jgi:hypothetical protein
MKPDRIGAALLVLFALVACTSVELAENKPHELPAQPVAPAPQVEPPASGRIAPPMNTNRMPPAVTTAPVSPPAAHVPQPIAPQAPRPISSCDPGGCWIGGERYNGGAGGTYLDKSGRLCQGNGNWMQCF